MEAQKRICNNCKVEKYIVIDFCLGSKQCRKCRMEKERIRKRKMGIDPKMAWKKRNFNLAKKGKDPRDKILQIE